MRHTMMSVWVDFFFYKHLQYFMLLNQDTHINKGQTWEFEWVCWQRDDKITRRKIAINQRQDRLLEEV